MLVVYDEIQQLAANRTTYELLSTWSAAPLLTASRNPSGKSGGSSFASTALNLRELLSQSTSPSSMASPSTSLTSGVTGIGFEFAMLFSQCCVPRNMAINPSVSAVTPLADGSAVLAGHRIG